MEIIMRQSQTSRSFRLIWEICYALLMIVAVIILFFWYATQNSRRMIERILLHSYMKL